MASLRLLTALSGLAAVRGIATRPGRRSEALPFLEAPSAPWLDGSVVRDFGFDPLGLATSRGVLTFYREAEIKHSRLAMLAAAGWPVSELLDRPLADLFGTDSKLGVQGTAPSVLNGGLGDISPVFWGASLGLAAAFELYALRRMLPASEAVKGDVTEPGDLYFDPLGFLPVERLRRKRMTLAELKHGRLAMVAVVAYAAEEFLLETPVVEHSHTFFKPFWAW